MKKLFLTTVLFLSCLFSTHHVFGKDELLKAILQGESLENIEQTLEDNPDEQTIKQMNKALKHAILIFRYNDLTDLIKLFDKYTDDAGVETLLTIKEESSVFGIENTFIPDFIGSIRDRKTPFLEYVKLKKSLQTDEDVKNLSKETRNQLNKSFSKLVDENYARSLIMDESPISHIIRNLNFSLKNKKGTLNQYIENSKWATTTKRKKEMQEVVKKQTESIELLLERIEKIKALKNTISSHQANLELISNSYDLLSQEDKGTLESSMHELAQNDVMNYLSDEHPI